MEGTEKKKKKVIIEYPYTYIHRAPADEVLRKLQNYLHGTRQDSMYLMKSDNRVRGIRTAIILLIQQDYKLEINIHIHSVLRTEEYRVE